MKPIKQLINLLRYDEGWSNEIDSIRIPLADLIEGVEDTGSHQFDDAIDEITVNLLTARNKSGFKDPLEAWTDSAIRQLGIYQDLTAESPKMADAIKKLFRHL